MAAGVPSIYMSILQAAPQPIRDIYGGAVLNEVNFDSPSGHQRRSDKPATEALRQTRYQGIRGAPTNPLSGNSVHYT